MKGTIPSTHWGQCSGQLGTVHIGVRPKWLVGYLKPAAQLGLFIRERSLVRNSIYFLLGFQSGEIDEDRLKEYKEKLHNDDSYFEQETTRIVMILENTVEAIRAKIIGCLYMNMINGRITHSEFCEYSDLTNRLYITEFECLCDENHGIQSHTSNRLVALGIMKSGMRFADENNDGGIRIYRLSGWTPFGKKYADLISGVVNTES